MGSKIHKINHLVMYMQNKQKTYAYPRNRLFRIPARALGRLILPLAFRLKINGKENFPKNGPLLVVANHVAVMEAVLMTVYTPWLVELIGGSDIPHEKTTDWIINAYSYIPVKRGHTDRSALKNALGVLAQNGVIGLFPEGGTWAAGRMRPQTGVAWLSYQGNAPVLPIGFGGLAGALGDAFRLKRPKLTMNIGKVIPADSIPPDRKRKEYLEEYAIKILDSINDLVPLEDRQKTTIRDECFELETAVKHTTTWQNPPANLDIIHRSGLARFLHSPVILKVYKKNLNRDIRAIQDIAQTRNPEEIANTLIQVLDYLDNENPYFFTYRFGGPEADNMRKGIEELLKLARWAADSNHILKIVPIRRYYSLEKQREVIQYEQERFENWM
ncbi:MAG: 1-acyl-sn-glycerol-3-phosphate acyltransferase [Chloroflexi bacterium]|nr:MAG: 1-acyl-sn-glycerol-3-phosphate acyltransferase [Chloroflexota bacterium]